MCLAAQETFPRFWGAEDGTNNLSQSQVKEDILSQGMADQKAVVGVGASRFQQIIVSIFEQPAIWVCELPGWYSEDLDGWGIGRAGQR